MWEITLVVALALYNNIANLIPAFNGPYFVPINCATAAGVLAFGIALLDLNLLDIGLVGLGVEDAAVGIALGLAVTAPLFAALRWPRAAARIADRRVENLGGGALAYQTLVRIPLGTALLEELAFRGVLFAALRTEGDLGASVMASAVFGIWHISPTLNMVRANRPDADPSVALRTVVGAVVLTAGAGLLLVWLRLESEGLLLPWALHATINSSATVAAVLAHRRVRSSR